MAQRQRVTPTNPSGNKMGKVCISVPLEQQQRVKLIAKQRGCSDAVVYREAIAKLTETELMAITGG